jgi:tetratricopeptide (TPR) repeat protein
MATFLKNVLISVTVLTCILLPGCDNNTVDDTENRIAPMLEGMGDLHHPITTNNEMAQRFFNQGLVLSYGFNHEEARRSFAEAARLDPDCPMAYWGIALVLGPNINASMEDDAVQPAYEAIQTALSLVHNASEKEQAYIQALSTRYSPQPEENREYLDIAYAEVMRELARNYPDDPDATALLAEALMDLHPWDYWEKDGLPRPWTPEILNVIEEGLERWPDHPGLNHFYIHAVEASADPGRATESADRLRNLVPGAGHLVHMPAHIYIRTGRYHDAIVANERAIEADSEYINQCRAQGIYPVAYVPHNHHFLSAAAAMAGVRAKAISAARHMVMHQDHDLMRMPGFGTLQHYTTISYYTMVRFGMWDEILNKSMPESDLRYPTGIWHFARGMAYTGTDRLDEAEKELAELIRIAADTTLRSVTIWDINTTDNLVQIANEILQGEILAKQGRYDESIAHLRRAVQFENDLLYDEPPPWYIPARHYLGTVLLEAGNAAAAEVVYKEDLITYPENGWALYGLYLSLSAQGKDEEASLVKKRFDDAWAFADITITSSRF